MTLKVDQIGRRAVIEINPDDYFLVKSDDNWRGDFALAPRIDMSYKGKDDQEGVPSIFLSKNDAEKMRSIGITEIS